MRIALLGAPGTGRSALAEALAGALQAAGHHDVMVDVSAAPPAAGQRDGCALTLLTGLDGPCPPGSEQADAALRLALRHAGVRYQVVYGDLDERLRSALRAVQPLLPGVAARAETPARWSWNCERCGDAGCEHRLFSGPWRRAPPATDGT
jgi:Mrp family chromosome partitioning ATPase